MKDRSLAATEPQREAEVAGWPVGSEVVARVAPACAASEQYRILHHRLERSRAAAPFSTLAVTSALPGEGKSVTCVNLALVAAAADAGRRVLLVDADLRRPRASSLLGVEPRPGLSELLLGEADLAACLQMPPASSLSVVPAGDGREAALPLASGAAMRALLADWRARFDEVYLDIPPVLPPAGGALLATLSDASLLVVRAGKTPRSRVAQAREALAGTRLLGCVLNAVEVS